VFECKESVQKFGEVRNNDVAKFIQNIIVEEKLFIVNDTRKGKNVLLDLFADGKNVGVVHHQSHHPLRVLTFMPKAAHIMGKPMATIIRRAAAR